MMTSLASHLQLNENAFDLLTGNVSNEVLRGLDVTDFEKTIGVSRDEFSAKVAALRDLKKDSNVGLVIEDARIFRNALTVVVNELGNAEFQTRTGCTFEEGKAILNALNGFVANNGGRD